MNCYATKIEEINQQTLSDLQARMRGIARLTERDAFRVDGAMAGIKRDVQHHTLAADRIQEQLSRLDELLPDPDELPPQKEK